MLTATPWARAPPSTTRRRAWVSSCQPECHHRRINLTVVASHRSLLALMLVDQLFDLMIIELKYDFVNGRRKVVAAGRSGNASTAGGRTVPRRTAVPEVTTGSRTDLAGGFDTTCRLGPCRGNLHQGQARRTPIGGRSVNQPSSGTQPAAASGTVIVLTGPPGTVADTAG